MEVCPRCGIQVEHLKPVRSDILVKMQEQGEANPGAVCSACESDIHRDLSNAGSGILAAQEKAKDEYRRQLWKSRMALLKKGRMATNKKSYADAAACFEKYLKILEIIFEVPEGDKLTPSHLRSFAKTSEITSITTVYWDLLRIYDSHSNFHGKMNRVAEQLATFCQYSPIYAVIVRKATSYIRKAKNPDAIKYFLKLARADKPRCFIATAAFESPLAPEVLWLRQFRDQQLKTQPWGRSFIHSYYKVSPAVASFLDQVPILKPLIRGALRAVIFCVSRFTN